ncbi:MAG TPA: hypothetical protein VGA70_06095 [Longimicrobiales bacterium]
MKAATFRSVLCAVAALAGPVPGAAQAPVDVPLPTVLEPVYTVGAVDGADWEVLGGVAAVAFDPAGRLAILDSGNDRVVLVGRDGRHVRTIGRSGRGPGELSRPMGLAATGTGELVVFDAGSGALVVYDTAGTFLRQFRPPFGRGYPGARLRAMPGGGVVSASGDGVALIDPRDGESPFHTLNRYDLVDSGEPVALAEAWRALAGAASGGQEVAGRQVGFTALPAFAPGLHFDVLPDGRLAFADSTDYRIEIVAGTGAGGGVAVVGRPLRPRPTTDRDRDRERERRRQRAAGVAPGGRTLPVAGRGSLERQLALLEFWPEIPVIRGLRADPAGRLWVARAPNADGATPIDLLTGDGTYLGTLRVPELAVPDALGPGGLVAFVEEGELGEPRVRVAVLTRGGG